MPLSDTKSIIFDLDGTLVDSAPDIIAALNHTLDIIDRPHLSDEIARPMVSHGSKYMLTKALEASGGTDGIDIDAIWPTLIDYYVENISIHTKPYPGVLDLLDNCKSANISMGICTNKFEGMAVDLLRDLQIDGYFSAITGSDTFDFKKPDGRHITETLRIMNSPAPAIMIGDSMNDILAAKNAGWKSVAVSFGYSDVPAIELAADHTVDSIADIWSLIAS